MRYRQRIMRWLGLAVSCGFLVFAAGCATSSAPTPIATPAAPVLEEVRTVPYSDLGVIVDGTYEFSQFAYAPAHTIFPIWRSKSSETGESPTYHLPPMLVFEMSHLRAALGRAISSGKLPGAPQAPPRYRMSWAAELTNEELRKAAASHLNTKLSTNRFNAEMFSILPYRWLEAEAIFENGTRMKLLPETVTRQSGVTLAPQTTVTFVANGTEEELSELVERANIQISAFVKGFTVKQNIVHGSLSVFAQQDFVQDLVGDAVWENVQSYRNGSGGLTANLGPINIGAKGGGGSSKLKRNSLVTRNQILAVSRRCASKIEVGGWLETGGADYEKRRDELMDKIYNTLSTRFEAILVDIADTGKIILDERIKEDLKPDQIGKLETQIKQKWDSKKEDKKKTEGSFAGATGSADSTSKFDLVMDDDIQWSGEGQATVPKSIRLHQVNQGTVDQLASMRFVTSEASEASSLAVTKAVFVDEIPTKLVEKQTPNVGFAIPRMANVSGGDEDIHSGNGSPTELRMWHTEPTETADEIRVTVTCEVYEVPDDHTKLRGTTTVRLTKPLDFGSLAVPGPEYFGYVSPETYNNYRGRRITKYSLNLRVSGRQHGWVTVATNPKSIIQGLQIWPDDGGNDHEGNAKARGNIAIPYLALPPGGKATTKKYVVR